MLYVVLQWLLLCYAWCRRGCHYATCSVTGAVVRLCGHVVVMAMAHAVSWSLLLWHVMLLL